MPKVMVGIPTTRHGRWSREWDAAKNGIVFPLGSAIGWHYTYDTPIAEARNELCAIALANNYEYLLFLSDDVLPPPDMALRMLNTIGQTFLDEHERPVRASMITGVYWRKGSPTEAYIYRDILRGWYRDWKRGDFFAVDFAGCDALLLEVSMLRELAEKDPGQPFFSTDYVWNDGDPPSAMHTEDFWFYTRARQFGYRLFCDSAIQCLHEDRATGLFYGLTDDLPQAGGIALLPDTGLRVADLGAGAWSRYLGENITLVRFDGRESVRPDVQCDIRHIPDEWFGTFDVVRASHSLEHLPREDTGATILHWAKLLKDGGTLLISVPNMEYAFTTILEGPDGEAVRYARKMVWGSQDNPLDFHLTGFTPHQFQRIFELLGFADVTLVMEEEGVNMRVEATYRAPAPLRPLLASWEQIREQELTTAIMPNGATYVPPAKEGGDPAAPDAPPVGDSHRDEEDPPAESPADGRKRPTAGPDLSRAPDLRREPQEVAGRGPGSPQRPGESEAVSARADR